MAAGTKRRTGRQKRVAARAAPPTVNPAPPGQRGGQYRPLSDAALSAIYETALKLLADPGMGEVPEALARDLIRAGASEGRPGRISIPRSLVEKAIETTPKRFTLHGRDPARSIEVGGDAVYFGTGGAAVQTLDMDSGNACRSA